MHAFYSSIPEQASCLQEKAALNQIPRFWKAKIPLFIEQAGYIIKTADSIQEFNEVMDLRREIFLGEFSGCEIDDESDLESIDLHADFLIVKEKRSGQIIASYRMLCSQFTDSFYSQSEFHISDFLAKPGGKLELSRALVKKTCRKGIAIHLLWRGIAACMKHTNSRYLFGCSSFSSLDMSKVIDLYHLIKQRHAISDAFSVTPLPNYRIVSIEDLLAKKNTYSSNERLIPPLLASYLKAGAKIYGPPAIDLRFTCFDLFTILDFQNLASNYIRKYVS